MFLSAFLLLCLGLPAVALEPEKEIALGRKVGAELERKVTRGRDLRVEARLRMLLQNLLRELETPFDYEVRLIENDSPNAFALPGGLLYVHRGLVDFVRSDHELAGILAHEIMHVEKSHGVRQAARNQRLNLLSLGVIVATKGQGAAVFLAGVTQTAITSSYSREYEEEADQGGLRLLHRGGYEPTGLVSVMERMEEEGWKRPHRELGVYMDHPATEERVAYLIQSMKANRWPLRRKISLQILRPSWEIRADTATLFMDGEPCWEVPSSLVSSEDMAVLVRGVEEGLQMEAPPYEIVLKESPRRSILYAGNHLLCSCASKDLRHRLPLLRTALVDLLNKAKRSHPLGRYLE